MKFITLSLLCASLFMVSACLPEKEIDPNAAIENIKIHEAYAFATMPGGATGAAFMVIENLSNEDDALITASTDVAGITEIHENLIDPDDGMMMMRKIKKIDLPQGEKVTLKPTGLHVMLLKLKSPLTLDSNFPLTLTFEKAGDKIINVNVIQPGTKPDAHSGH